MNPVPVYLAGPDVFLPDAADVGRTKQAMCARHGLDGRFPLDAVMAPVVDVRTLPPLEQAKVFFECCVTMMDACTAGIANLTPFRGPSADVGTAFELGYLLGTGKRVFGYTADAADYHERVEPDGLMVETFGLVDNLMLEGAVMRGGGRVVRVSETGPGRLAALGAFEECVRVAAQTLGAG